MSIWIQPALLCLYLYDKRDKFSLNIGKRQFPWAPSRDGMTCPEDSFSSCAWSLVFFSPLLFANTTPLDLRLPEVPVCPVSIWFIIVHPYTLNTRLLTYNYSIRSQSIVCVWWTFFCCCFPTLRDLASAIFRTYQGMFAHMKEWAHFVMNNFSLHLFLLKVATFGKSKSTESTCLATFFLFLFPLFLTHSQNLSFSNSFVVHLQLQNSVASFYTS